MKTLFAVLLLSLVSLTTAKADDSLPEGHWLSQKLDKSKNIIVTYENWFEENTTEGRVFRSKIVNQTNVETAPAPSSSPSHPTQSTLKATTWYCYAHDFIDGHAVNDPKDDSCISSYYKAKGNCQEVAAKNSLLRCQSKSPNPTTCELNIKKDCFPETQRYGSKN